MPDCKAKHFWTKVFLDTGCYPELEEVKGFCLSLRNDYPPVQRTDWCNPEGLRELQRKLEQLEALERSSEQ